MHKTFFALLLMMASLCFTQHSANRYPATQGDNMGKGFFTIKPNTPVELNFEGEEARQMRTTYAKPWA